MSEYINNAAQRKEMLKEVLRGLHEGRPLDEVQAQFRELVKVADAGEIAEVEQMLIAEGLPPSEIQNLCDLHVAAVREALDENDIPESIPGHPVYTFLAENQAAEQVLQALRRAVERYIAEPVEVNRASAAAILTQLRDYARHYLRKENLLFPILERYGFSGPSQVMWGIHDQIRAGMKTAAAAAEEPAGPDAARDLLAVFEQFEAPMRDMFYKEEKILYPASLQRLNDDDWTAIRAQEEELGHFLVTPSSQWQPAPERAREKILAEEAGGAVKPGPARAGLFKLETGLLTPGQINLLLTHLPVDVTFVDEHDEVRFFSQGKDRIFERQEAIIGRKVQFCHPPTSVDRVQKILDAFRAGTRDEAEFWIKMGGKFVHIRYFAMRDQSGVYRGTLEVTQDVTGIRALEGERRLLDE
jgi:hypothetical protein